MRKINYIKELKLEKHPEGGYYHRTYRSQENVKPLSSHFMHTKERSASTCIYYYLENDDYSSWHRIKSDEIWHYYTGNSPVNIFAIDEEGKFRKYLLGN